MSNLGRIRLKIFELGGCESVAPGIVTPVYEELLAQIEQERGIHFPTAYAEFVQEFGGCAFGKPVDFPCQTCRERHTIGFFYGAGKKEQFTLQRVLTIYAPVLPRELLPIGEEQGGNQICIAHSGPDSDKIFWWNRRDEGAHVVANSLGDWIESMNVTNE